MVATEIAVAVYAEGEQEEQQSTLADLLFQQAIIEQIKKGQPPRDYCGDNLVIYPVPTGFGIVR